MVPPVGDARRSASCLRGILGEGGPGRYCCPCGTYVVGREDLGTQRFKVGYGRSFESVVAARYYLYDNKSFSCISLRVLYLTSKFILLEGKRVVVG